MFASSPSWSTASLMEKILDTPTPCLMKSSCKSSSLNTWSSLLSSKPKEWRMTRDIWIDASHQLNIHWRSHQQTISLILISRGSLKRVGQLMKSSNISRPWAEVMILGWWTEELPETPIRHQFDFEDLKDRIGCSKPEWCDTLQRQDIHKCI